MAFERIPTDIQLFWNEIKSQKKTTSKIDLCTLGQYLCSQNLLSLDGMIP